MSQWGDNNWKQKVLSETEYAMSDYDMDSIEAAEGLIKVAIYLLENSSSRDKTLSKIYKKARQDAYDEIMGKLKNSENG